MKPEKREHDRVHRNRDQAMKRILLCFLVLCIWATPSHADERTSVNFTVRNDAVSSGSGTAVSPSFSISGTISNPNESEVQSSLFISRTESWMPGDAGLPLLAGDMNGDGKVDVVDVLYALRCAAGIIKPAEPQISIGDVAPIVNGTSQPDGRVDIGDAVVLLRRSVGLGDQ